jgi:hypothetical protein
MQKQRWCKARRMYSADEPAQHALFNATMFAGHLGARRQPWTRKLTAPILASLPQTQIIQHCRKHTSFNILLPLPGAACMPSVCMPFCTCQ